MIEQLTVTGFAVARDVTLAPGPGLNVITGETGAGKSIIVDALDFLFGGRHGRGVVADGAESARVRASLRTGDDFVAVERTVRLSGRTAGRIGDDSAPAERLRELGARVIDIHGQSEQLTLLRPAVQLAVLDAFGGLRDQRDALAAWVRELRALRREIEAIGADSRERERLLDQLRFEVDEIAQAGLVSGEDEALRREQRRLASIERLLAASATALEALDAPAIAEAVAALEEIAESDPDATVLAAEGATLEQTAADLGRSLRAYRETLEDDPERRETIEARLDLIARLRRKYGESVATILQHESSARERLQAMETAGSSLEELRERAAALAASAAEGSAALSLDRREAAGRLIAEVAAELARLEMPGASLAAGFACEDNPDGLAVTLPDYEVVAPDAAPSGGGESGRRAFTESGVDQMELLAAFNPGSPPRPLRRVASGGETSRFLLALTTVLGAAAEPRLVVLDEVDEGVGGRAGSVVGEALRRLAERHQVLCVTHLPQVAAYGARHFVVTKASEDDRTWSDIEEVEGEARLREIALMLGGDTPANRAAAADLLQSAGE
ncbi:MAG: DNA repair protein RecN [Chloroflexota bacterium]|nr:DNA repair protein RecN [Chloroflexota bacterium]